MDATHGAGEPRSPGAAILQPGLLVLPASWRAAPFECLI